MCEGGRAWVCRRVKWSGIAKVSTFYPLDSIEDGAAKSRVGPHSSRGSIFSATYKWGQDGSRTGRLAPPSRHLHSLPSLLPSPHNFAPRLSPAPPVRRPPRGSPTVPLLFQFKQKPQSGSSVSARWTHGRAFFRALAQLRVSVSKSKTVRRSEGRYSRHSPSPIRRRRRRRAN